MSDESPLTRALALIRADPKQRAAYELGKERGFADGYAQGWQDSPESDAEAYDDSTSKAAAYLLLAETPPEPPKQGASISIAAAAEIIRLYAPEMVDSIEADMRMAAGEGETPRVWTVDGAFALVGRVSAHHDAVQVARDAALWAAHDFANAADSDARAATEGALRGACERLAALVGGDRG